MAAKTLREQAAALLAEAAALDAETDALKAAGAFDADGNRKREAMNRPIKAVRNNENPAENATSCGCTDAATEIGPRRCA